MYKRLVTIYCLQLLFMLNTYATVAERPTGNSNKKHPFHSKELLGMGCLFLDMYTKLFDYTSRVEFYKVEEVSEDKEKCFFRTLQVFKDNSYNKDKSIGEYLVIPKSYDVGRLLKRAQGIYGKISGGSKNDLQKYATVNRVLAVNFSNYTTKSIKRIELLDTGLLYKFEDMNSSYVDESYKKFEELYGEKDPYTLFFKSLVNDKYTNFEKRVGEINFQGYIAIVNDYGEERFMKFMIGKKQRKVGEIVLKRYKEMKENGTLEEFLKRSHTIK